ncbi:MAG: rod shape-determining protein MreC [Patescibacteria group bacterium]|nr:rod shape-determining protein MreC [Patescibacteria group bacterium]
MARYGSDNRRLVVGLAVGALVFSALAASGALTTISRPVTRAFLTLAGPLHGAGAAMSGWFGRLAAGCDPEDWRGKYEELKTEQAKLLALAAENASLKEAVAYRETAGTNVVTARVVNESGDDYSRAIIIDRGSADGLVVGQPAITGNGIIVGKIIDVGANSAVIQPLTDSRSRLAVTVQNTQETIGVLEGERGLGLIISLIPQAETVLEGDTVITSGLEPGIPRGLTVGIVGKVTASTQDPFQTASIQPFKASLHPTYVQVVRTTATER